MGRVWRRRFPCEDVNPCWEEGKSHWVMVLGCFRAKPHPTEVLNRTDNVERRGGCYLCLLCSSGSADLPWPPAAGGHDLTPTGTRRRNRPRSCLGTLHERQKRVKNRVFTPTGNLRHEQSPQSFSKHEKRNFPSPLANPQHLQQGFYTLFSIYIDFIGFTEFYSVTPLFRSQVLPSAANLSNSAEVCSSPWWEGVNLSPQRCKRRL